MSEPAFQTHATLVDSTSALLSLLDSLIDLPIDPPSLYLDLEGIKLGRHGSISLIGLHVAPQSKSYGIDVHVLGNETFSTTNSSGISLQNILESKTIPKVFFDIRNDSDAMYSLFQISVNGIIDLQLLELATRLGSRKWVAGLARCIEQGIHVPTATKQSWRSTKDAVGRLCYPEKGGRYEVFNERPIRKDILQYCTRDVELLPMLWKEYSVKLRKPNQGCWRSMIRKETRERIRQSQSPGYDGHSREKAFGPFDTDYFEREVERWNENVWMLQHQDDMVLTEDDHWVCPPAKEATKSSVFTLVADKC